MKTIFLTILVYIVGVVIGYIIRKYRERAKTIPYNDIFDVACEKANTQIDKDDKWTEHQMIEYLFEYYRNDRNHLYYHDVMEVVKTLLVDNKIKVR